MAKRNLITQQRKNKHMKDIKNLFKILQNHERRLAILEGSGKIVEKKNSWYKPGSTIDKIIKLISEGFFKDLKSIKEIISELKEKDFHLKASDLTLPLRKIVREGLLKKTKQLPSGKISKKWLYKKA